MFDFFQENLIENGHYNGTWDFTLIDQAAIHVKTKKDYLSVSKENFKIVNFMCEDIKLEYNNSKQRKH